MDLQKPQGDETPRDIIVDNHKELSPSKKRLFIGGGGVLLVIALMAGFSIYNNTSINAASCVASEYVSGAQDKCVGYVQKMVNGIIAHYGTISHNNVILPSNELSVTGKLDQKTRDKIDALRRYTKASTKGATFQKSDWLTVCTWARQAYRAYTADVRPKAVQTARDAYKSTGCANLIAVTSSDDVTAPAPVEGVSASDETIADTPQKDDQPTMSQQGSATASTRKASAEKTIGIPRLSITSWNIEGGNPDNNKNSASRAAFTRTRSEGLTALTASSDIVALQESHLHGFRNAITSNFACSSDACKLASVNLVNAYSRKNASKEDGSLPASVPILWNKTRLQLQDYGYYTALGSGYRDAAGNWVSWKWITWVKLKDLASDQAFFVVNTHVVAGIEAKGMPKYDLSKAVSKLSKTQKAAYQRLNTFNAHIDLLITLVDYLKEQSLPIFVAGDFNVNYRYDSTLETPYKDFPYAKLGAEALKSNYQLTGLNNIANTVGTEGSGNRLIDYIFSWDKGNVDYFSTAIESNRYGSDHSPVTLTVGLE